MENMPLTRHTISGAVSNEPQHIVDHPVFGQYLEVVPEGTKPFTPGHFLPGTIAQRAEAKQAKDDAKQAKDNATTPEKKDNK